MKIDRNTSVQKAYQNLKNAVFGWQDKTINTLKNWGFCGGMQLNQTGNKKLEGYAKIMNPHDGGNCGILASAYAVFKEISVEQNATKREVLIGKLEEFALKGLYDFETEVVVNDSKISLVESNEGSYLERQVGATLMLDLIDQIRHQPDRALDLATKLFADEKTSVLVCKLMRYSMGHLAKADLKNKCEGLSFDDKFAHEYAYNENVCNLVGINEYGSYIPDARPCLDAGLFKLMFEYIKMPMSFITLQEKDNEETKDLIDPKSNYALVLNMDKCSGLEATNHFYLAAKNLEGNMRQEGSTQ